DRRWADSNNQSASAFTTLLVTAVIVGAILILVAVLLLDRSRRWLTQATTLERRLRSTITAVQASLLPAAIPELDNVDVALAYRPASADADVGGDFYDLNTSQSGLVTISIGDVCGHDIHAAIVTGLVRHTINAASQHLTDPAEVLRWANQALNSHDTDGRFVSAAHAHLHPPNPDGHALLDIALAGHPYPIMVPADGRPSFEIGTAGTLLGITADPKITTTGITLAPGDQLVLYTDGLTENSQPRLSTNDILTVIDNSRRSTAAETRTSLMQHYDTLDRRGRHDDVAVVIIQLQPAASPASGLAGRGPAQPVEPAIGQVDCAR
ncbi:MAG: serine/threonine-protein phosphatase, partial [Ilumatobacteraceae bacterium]|nr:serine/threonine-protein phosphatase [Ilumatobacteraceae bacterium]